MRAFTVTLLLLLVACGGSTGPAGLDPTGARHQRFRPGRFLADLVRSVGSSRHRGRADGHDAVRAFHSTQIADSVRFMPRWGRPAWIRSRPPGTNLDEELVAWFDPKNGLPTASPANIHSAWRHDIRRARPLFPPHTGGERAALLVLAGMRPDCPDLLHRLPDRIRGEHAHGAKSAAAAVGRTWPHASGRSGCTPGSCSQSSSA